MSINTAIVTPHRAALAARRKPDHLALRPGPGRQAISGSPLTVTAWPDPPSVIVVEAHQQPNPRIDNAVVFNPDGTERLRLKPPAVSPEPSRDIGFDQVYADPSGLVAVFATRTGDFWGRPDLTTGEPKNIARWR
jgi:hypothetical protein